MFQFGRFPSRLRGMTRHYPSQVSPFGHLRLSRSYTPHRRFSQYNTSFIGARYLGIHCVPSFAFRTHRTEYPALLARASRYYLRVDYSTVKLHSPTQISEHGDKGTRTLDLVSAIDALSQLSYIPSHGDKGTRTPDLLGANEALSQLSYVPLYRTTQVGLARLELATSRLSGVRSNQLSYSPKSISRRSNYLTANNTIAG